jgi:hypothetical protein
MVWVCVHTCGMQWNSSRRRAFCADQTGVIRTSADGIAATCVSEGTPLP